MIDEPKKPIINVPEADLSTPPITLHEVEEEIKKRVSLIDHEFTMGFDIIKNQPKSVTFFGSARLPSNNEHYLRAERIAKKLAALGYSVITGGGPGIMEAANKGAFEAHGQSLGFTIELPHEQVKNPYLTINADFYYFFVRKVMMSFSAEAYLFFPGGFGTLDECFEILTLVQTSKIEKVPVILVGNEYWKALENFMREHMYAHGKLIDESDMNLYTITEDEDEIVEIIKKAPTRNGVRFTYKEK